MSEPGKIANRLLSKFAKFVNQQMEIPDIPNALPLAAGFLRDVNFHFAEYTIRPHEDQGPDQGAEATQYHVERREGQKMDAALKQLDSSVTDLHSAADEGNQAGSEKALNNRRRCSRRAEGPGP